MYRLEHIEILWLLLAVPVCWLLYFNVANWRTKAAKQLAETDLFDRLIPLKSRARTAIKMILLTLATASIIVGLANPQIGSKLQEVKREGVDIMIALDLSNSMLAEDLSPNRLERSKLAIQQFIDKLKSDRIGIVVFGGQAYVQLPITTDYAAAKLFLSTINTDIIPTQGTAIGAAIDLCMQSFDFKTPTNKSIIVITDGENHEDDALQSAKIAREKDVIVHTIGVGSADGAPIPIYRGSEHYGFRKDTEGNTIMTKLNELMLQEIAEAGSGIYVHASNAQGGLNYILDEIEKAEKVEFGSKIFTDYEDRFQYFIGLGLVLLIIEQLLFDRKPRWSKNLNIFEVKK